MSLNDLNCIICKSPLSRPSFADQGRDVAIFDCPRCLLFQVTGTDAVVIPAKLVAHDEKRLLVSHYIHRIRRSNDVAKISSKTVEQILASERYPTPVEQLNNLVLFLGEKSQGPGYAVPFDLRTDVSIIGAQSQQGFVFVAKAASAQGLIDTVGKDSVGPGIEHGRPVYLTFEGWQRFEELRRGTPSGRRAFMAMKFGDPELDRLLQLHIKPAVAQTGFTLETVGDNRKAGLIDDKIRVDIRAARFLIADLTHANNGAYWEAGYAEGLGKPVVYMCRRDVFDEVSTRPHFDTNHHTTVMWLDSELDRTVEDLKATIRATIPEAVQQD